MKKLWMLLLFATSLAVGCRSKPALPDGAKEIARDRAGALIIMGNGVAYGKILQKLGGGLGGPR